MHQEYWDRTTSYILYVKQKKVRSYRITTAIQITDRFFFKASLLLNFDDVPVSQNSELTDHTLWYTRPTANLPK